MKLTRRRKKLVVIVMLVVTCFLTACASEPQNKNPYNVTVLEQSSDFYVNDFAGILSDEQKADMMTRAIALEEEYDGIQVVVTTVESLEKTVVSHDGDETANVYDIEQLTYAMYSQYGIGKDDMGILILFSVGDRKVRIETGYQMQNYITDQKSGQLLDNNGMEYFQNDQFADGLVVLQTAVIDEIKMIVPNDWSLETEEINEEETRNQIISDLSSETENKSNNGILYVMIGSIGAFFVTVYAFVYNLFSSKKKRKAEVEAHAKALRDKDAQHQKEVERIRQDHKSSVDEVIKKCQEIFNKKQQEFNFIRDELIQERKLHEDTKNELSTLQEKFRRIQLLHPESNFDHEVTEMITEEYKAEAKVLDEKLLKIVAEEPDKDKVELFSKAKGLWFSTPLKVRKYLTVDSQVILSKLTASNELLREFEAAEKEKQDKAIALAIHQKMKAVCAENPKGNHSNYKVISEVQELFSKMTDEQKEFLDDPELLKKFDELHLDAFADYKYFSQAKDANAKVREVVSKITTGKAEHLDDLLKVRENILKLAKNAKQYLDKELLSRLHQVIQEAENDYEEQEKVKKKKRQQVLNARNYNSRSNFVSHSYFSHTGNGGRPSGGGATRNF